MNFLTTCIFDHGAIGQLPKTLKGQGVTKAFVVTDPGIKSIGLLDKVLEQIDIPCDVFAETEPNPTETQAKQASEVFKASGCDGIIALGGGSSMDIAKAIGLMATHEPPFEQYGALVGGARKIKAIPPLIAIPTTAGTGSEVSIGAVIILENGRKETIVSNHLIPKVAICDPSLTLGLPPMLTAATGMDAVTHCIEAILVPAPNPPAEGIGYDGVARAIGDGWLKKAVQDGSDPDARWHMMMASYEGALAFVKGLGGVHALSHAAGRLHDLKLHHGTLNAIWLPHLLRHNVGSADEKYARLRKMMNLPESADLGDAIAKLIQDIGIPEKLSDIGLTAAHGETVVDYALKDLAHATNSKKLDRADYEKLYEIAL
ncbi:iron-containing alcohol dehydrogenase [Ponticaulis profundi]|uniref:Iron-containing alcohol dehydrogenase n=1 Tax=Ponticaulis profundi TaxID=2665222 RepID=A0ABW1SC70_9PROT